MNKRMVAHKDSIHWESQKALVPSYASNGLIAQITYTPRGWTELIKVGTDTVYETTDLDYDGVGQLIKATLPDGSYLSYSYDAAHRLTNASSPTGTQSYGYDANGNRSSADQARDIIAALQEWTRDE